MARLCETEGLTELQVEILKTVRQFVEGRPDLESEPAKVP